MSNQTSQLIPARPSPIRVFFTSRSHAGSWLVRGEQIASRRTNWHAAHDLDPHDISKFDLFCIVKKPSDDLLALLRREKKIIVYDVLDSWAQPKDGLTYTNLRGARELYAAHFLKYQFRACIFPNRTMLAHLGDLCSQATFIYHHYYPHLRTATIRKTPTCIAYQGNASYLGKWKALLEDICKRKGLNLLLNPEDLSEADIGFAARQGDHDSYLANHYKSNIKLANFYGCGLPCIVSNKELSYQETDNGDVRFFSTEEQLEHQVDALMNFETRLQIHKRFLKFRKNFHIDLIVSCYEAYFFHIIREFREAL